MNTNLASQFLEPIPGEDICGVDMSFSVLFDEIREARRQDDPALSQGDWETELKTAQWPRVKELAEDVLLHQSKDMQVVAWYTEALTRLKGFQGLAQGVAIMDGLCSDFWEFCYPSYDPDDLEERASKIEWLNREMPLVVREIPLTDRTSGGYSWLKWEESRAIDNLGLKDPEARERAVAEGRITGEIFDKAVMASGRGYYEKLQLQLQEAVTALVALEATVEQRFGNNAPSLRDLRNAVLGCEELVGKLLGRLGGRTETRAAAPAAGQGQGTGDSLPAAMPGGAAFSSNGGLIVNRNDAIAALRAVANYFRLNEPHSPVAFLADRAANWAEMPLDKWLAAVVKDDATLGQLRELLDIRNPG